jgi:hypothetical protein
VADAWSLAEKRKKPRYYLRLPVLITWTDASGLIHKEGGFTRDIATAGICVISRLSPPVGSDISVEALLDFPRSVSSQSGILTALMRVVRLEDEHDYRIFAAAGTFAGCGNLRHNRKSGPLSSSTSKGEVVR